MTEPTQAQIDAAKIGVRDEYGSNLCAWTDNGRRVCRIEFKEQCLCEQIAKAALTAAAEVEKNKADWKVCERCNCWVKRPLEWEPECSEVPDAMTKDFFGTAAAQVGPSLEDKDEIERAFEAGSKHAWASIEAATIERCAQAVETFNPTLASNPSWEAIHLVRDIAAAIRALATEGR